MNSNEKTRADPRELPGKPPYGYRWDKKKNQLAIDTEEAAIYRWIIQMYVKQDMSLRDITITLREKGIKCKRTEWSKSTLNCVLKNPVYYGGNPACKAPPLISKSQWNKIQARMKLKKVRSGRTVKNSDFFLRDVLRCARCGATVKPRLGSMRKDGTAPRYYVCYWAGTSRKNIEAETNRKKCSQPFLKAEMAETAVWRDVKRMLTIDPEQDAARFAALPPEDRKILVEDMLRGGTIAVNYRDDYAGDGVEALALDYQLQPSRSARQTFNSLSHRKLK